jgi:hypothetical protein
MITACPFCNAKTAPQARICTACGKLMSRACPSCKESIAANATACKYCGEESKAPEAPVPPVVFVDEPAGREQARCEADARRCCGRGRVAFWILVLALAGICTYSMMRPRIAHLLPPPAAAPVEKSDAPTRDF